MLGQLGIHRTGHYTESFTPYRHSSFPDGPSDLSVRGNTRELLEYNLGDYLRDPGEGKGRFLELNVESTIHEGNG